MKEWSGRWDSNPRLDLGKVPYYPYTTTAPEHENFITTHLRRQDPIGIRRFARNPQAQLHPWRATNYTSPSTVPPVLADLKYACCLDDRRLPLPFSKFGSLGAVGVNTSKFLAVFIKNRNLPMLMLAAPVLAQLGAFSFFQCFSPRPILSQLKRVRTSTVSSNNVRTTGSGKKSAASAHQSLQANIRNRLKNLRLSYESRNKT
jgi:hypothetical protein